MDGFRYWESSEILGSIQIEDTSWSLQKSPSQFFVCLILNPCWWHSCPVRTTKQTVQGVWRWDQKARYFCWLSFPWDDGMVATFKSLLEDHGLRCIQEKRRWVGRRAPNVQPGGGGGLVWGVSSLKKNCLRKLRYRVLPRWMERWFSWLPSKLLMHHQGHERKWLGSLKWKDSSRWILPWKCCLGDEAESKSKAALGWLEGSHWLLWSFQLEIAGISFLST